MTVNLFYQASAVKNEETNGAACGWRPQSYPDRAIGDPRRAIRRGEICARRNHYRASMTAKKARENMTSADSQLLKMPASVDANSGCGGGAASASGWPLSAGASLAACWPSAAVSLPQPATSAGSSWPAAKTFSGRKHAAPCSAVWRSGAGGGVWRK